MLIFLIVRFHSKSAHQNTKITRNKFVLLKNPRCKNTHTTIFDTGNLNSQPIFTKIVFFTATQQENKVFYRGLSSPNSQFSLFKYLTHSISSNQKGRVNQNRGHLTHSVETSMYIYLVSIIIARALKIS